MSKQKSKKCLNTLPRGKKMLKQILKYYTCEIILSSDYKERISYLKAYLGGDKQSLSPYTDEINRDKYTLYVYYHPFEQVTKEDKAIYIGLPNKKVQKGVVYVVPRKEYLTVTEEEEKIDALDLWQNTQSHYRVTFIECFPYLKEDSIKLMRYLQDYFNQRKASVQLKIVLYGESRRYGYSDLITEEQTMQEAYRTFKKLFAAAHILTFRSTSDMSECEGARLQDMAYSERLKQLKVHQIKEKYNAYLSLFSLDYEWTVENVLNIEKVEELFNYRYVQGKNQSNVVGVWRKNLYEKILVPSEKDWIECITLYQLELPYLDNEKEVKKILQYLWKSLDDTLAKQVKVKGTLHNELDYKMKTKALKQKFKEILIKFFESEGKYMIEEMLQRNFEIWANAVAFNLESVGQEEYSIYEK